MRTLQLRDGGEGGEMPALGLGTWLSEPGEVYRAVRAAIEVGYRHIDCAWIYLNEGEIGQALADALAAGDVRREQLWVTSKLWNDDHDPAHVPAALEGTLADLQLDYLDLYLVHWPVALRHGVTRPASAADFLSLDQMPLERTWEAMVALREGGRARQVGVSNFSTAKIDHIAAAVGVTPAVNQVEMHPFLQQRELLRDMGARGIVTTAYAPLGSRGRPAGMKRDDEVDLLDQPAVDEIAGALGVTAGQVLIAWALQRGTAVIPKSTNPGRIAENFAAAQVELSAAQVAALDALERGARYVDGRFWCPDGSPYTLEGLWG